MHERVIQALFALGFGSSLYFLLLFFLNAGIMTPLTQPAHPHVPPAKP